MRSRLIDIAIVIALIGSAMYYNAQYDAAFNKEYNRLVNNYIEEMKR